MVKTVVIFGSGLRVPCRDLPFYAVPGHGQTSVARFEFPVCRDYLSDMPTPIVLAPYDPEWPRMAASRAESLRVLGPVLLRVHHIGSTSVPGLAAKPVIDLMPLVTDLAALDRQRPRVEALGYDWRGEYGIPERRYCSLTDENGVRLVQLHFFTADSPQVIRHVAFRDYLRAYPDVATAYEEEKHRARDLHPDDVHAYTDEKDAWIRRTEIRALDWFAKQGSIGKISNHAI